MSDILGTDRSVALQSSIQKQLAVKGYSPEDDTVMAEYITIMLVNDKPPEQVTTELTELISDYDSTFTDWLFQEKNNPSPGEPPPHATYNAIESVSDDSPSDGRSHPQPTRPLYQQALNALPGQNSSPSAGHKRTASKRSPSPGGGGPLNKRRIVVADLPDRPRAMRDEQPGAPTGSATARTNRLKNSLLDRVGPKAGPDPVQERIRSVTQRSQTQPHALGVQMGAPSVLPIPGMDPGAMMMMQQQQPGFNPAMMNGGFPPGFEATVMAIQQMGQLAVQMGLVPGAMGMGVPNQMIAAGSRQPVGSRFLGDRRGNVGRGAGVNNQAIPGQSAPPPAQTPAPSSRTENTVIHAPTPVGPPACVPSSSSTAPPRPASPTLCKFVTNCSNPTCRYSHPSPVATIESGVVLSTDPCEKGLDCADKDCIYAHVSKAAKSAPRTTGVAVTAPTSNAPTVSQTLCKFDPNCSRPNCPYFHPSHNKRTAKIHPTNSSTACRFGAACTRADCPYSHPPGRVLPGQFSKGLDGAPPSLINSNISERETWNKSVDFRTKNTSAPLSVEPSSSGSPAPAIPDTVCPRSALVQAVLQRLENNYVIQIRGTPASGKSTLCSLIHNALDAKINSNGTPSSGRIYKYTGWPQDRYGTLHDRFRQGNPTWDGDRGPAINRYILLDEAQESYQDMALWDFIKDSNSRGSRNRIILFCRYGSPRPQLTDYPVPRPVRLAEEAMFSLRPSPANKIGLFLNMAEYQEVLKRYGEPVTIQPDLEEALYRWTSGHVGSVIAVLSFLCKRWSAFSKKQGVLSLEMYYQEYASFNDLADFIHGATACGLPAKDMMQIMARLFRRLLKTGNIVVKTIELPQDPDREALEQGTRAGWIQADDDFRRSETTYTFPSPLHMAAISWYLEPSAVPASFETIAQMAFEVIKRFKPSHLTGMGGQVGGRFDTYDPEALYQDEFYRRLLEVSGGPVRVTPEFASRSFSRPAGRIDLFIPGVKWGVECITEGDRLAQHSKRFDDSGTYDAWLRSNDMRDYILLDFRRSSPKVGYKNVRNLYHVVFNEECSTVTILNNCLANETSYELLDG